MKTYLTLFKDGTLGMWSKKTEKEDFQEGTRFFEMSDELPVIEICEWAARNYKHPKIKEIKL